MGATSQHPLRGCGRLPGDDFIQAQTLDTRDVLIFERKPAITGPAVGIIHVGFRPQSGRHSRRQRADVRAAAGSVVSHGEFCPGEPYVPARSGRARSRDCQLQLTQSTLNPDVPEFERRAGFIRECPPSPDGVQRYCACSHRELRHTSGDLYSRARRASRVDPMYIAWWRWDMK